MKALNLEAAQAVEMHMSQDVEDLVRADHAACMHQRARDGQPGPNGLAAEASWRFCAANNNLPRILLNYHARTSATVCNSLASTFPLARRPVMRLISASKGYSHGKRQHICRSPCSCCQHR